MIRNFFLMLFMLGVFISCNKDEGKGIIYTVSANAMIGISVNGWNDTQMQLHNKVGYRYSKSSQTYGGMLKAVVTLPAVDDSMRSVAGTILLNITPEDKVSYAAFDSKPLDQDIAYALMLRYNNETLKSLTGITSSIGELVENRTGGNTSVNTIISKLTTGQTVDKLAISYHSAQGYFAMVVFLQSDGRYIFSYRCG